MNKVKQSSLMLTLPLPPTLNETYRMGKGHYYKSKETKEWQEMVGWEIKRHYKSLHRLTGPLYVGLSLYLKRDRDIDSSTKGTLDSLEGLVYENDKQIVHLNVKKCTDKINPHMEIEIVSI